MKVFHFIDSYLRLTETFIYNYILASSKDEANQVFIFASRVENAANFPLPANVKLVMLPVDRNRRSITGWYRYIYQFFIDYPYWHKFIADMLKKHHGSVVHCHFGPYGINFQKALMSTHTHQNFVVSFYGFDAGYEVMAKKNYLDELTALWQQCTAVFCEGPFLRKKLYDLGLPEKKGLINPIIIDKALYTIKEEFNFPPAGEPLKFLVIGRFAEKKGIHISLKALGELKKNGFANFSVTLVGDGPLKDLYNRIITDYGMEAHVSFKGLLPLSDCKQLMAVSDVLLHPSLEAANKDSEGGAPTIIIEAQYMGMPVIASKHADIPFVMGYDDFLAEENDADDLKRVIVKFMETPANDIRTLVDRGRAHVLAQHTFENAPYMHHLENIAAVKE